jgi:hypothetical protein
MQRLKQDEQDFCDTALTFPLVSENAQAYRDYALMARRYQQSHWDGCNECQGLATVEQPVADIDGGGLREVQRGNH